MSGKGRPTKSEVDARRRRLLLYLVRSTLNSPEGLRRMVELVGVGERATRRDLEALEIELESCKEDELPQELAQAIEVADSYKDLQTLTSRIMSAVTEGSISEDRSKALLEGINVQRHLLRAERAEQPLEGLRALEILTPDEEALLAEYRKRLAGPPIQPGEAVPPPGGNA
jgi:hypothetical protein